MASATPEPQIFEPWEPGEAARQREAMLFGLWLFLATEVLFFGGLFLLYAHARALDPSSFAEGARHANAWFGTINTALLLTSSITATIADRAIRAGLTGLARTGWIATAALGTLFLAVKGMEYAEDFHEHLFPGPLFRFHSAGATEFWNFYWVITVVHAIHLSVGVALMLRLLWLNGRGQAIRRPAGAEVTTTYWHLVDIVWVTVYPLIYLVGRGHG